MAAGAGRSEGGGLSGKRRYSVSLAPVGRFPAFAPIRLAYFRLDSSNVYFSSGAPVRPFENWKTKFDQRFELLGIYEFFGNYSALQLDSSVVFGLLVFMIRRSQQRRSTRSTIGQCKISFRLISSSFRRSCFCGVLGTILIDR